MEQQSKFDCLIQGDSTHETGSFDPWIYLWGLAIQKPVRFMRAHFTKPELVLYFKKVEQTDPTIRTEMQKVGVECLDRMPFLSPACAHQFLLTLDLAEAT